MYGEIDTELNQHLATATAWSSWLVTMGDDDNFLNLEVFTALLGNSLHDGASFGTDSRGEGCVLDVATTVKLTGGLGLEARSNLES